MSMTKHLRRAELRLERIAQPRANSYGQIPAAEEREASPPIALPVPEDDRAHHGDGDSGQGEQQQHPRPQIVSVSESGQTDGGHDDERRQTANGEASHGAFWQVPDVTGRGRTGAE